MIRWNVLFYLLFCFAQSFAQIPVITRTDVEAGFTNTERVEREFTLVPRTENLGMSSGSPQTFNFAIIPGAVVAVDTERTIYLPPSGQPGATFFPTATSAGKLVDSSGGQIISTVQYFRIQDDGAYFLGFALHTQQGTTDSTEIFMYNPAALFLPLPLTIGTNRTSSDTMDVPPSRRVTNRSYIGDGYGTLSLPNGTVVSAIRVITERIELNYFGSMLFSRTKTRDVEYYGTDLSIAAFDDLDTLYTSGITTIDEFEYNVRTVPTGVQSDNGQHAADFSLYQNYPNPFNPSTTISWQSPVSSWQTLEVYDVLGNEVATLVDEYKPAGSYEVEFDAKGLSSGVYFYRIQAGSFIKTKKMILIR